MECGIEADLDTDDALADWSLAQEDDTPFRFALSAPCSSEDVEVTA